MVVQIYFKIRTKYSYWLESHVEVSDLHHATGILIKPLKNGPNYDRHSVSGPNFSYFLIFQKNKEIQEMSKNI